MTIDRLKLLKQDNKQLGRFAFRFLHLRFCLLASLFLITVILVGLFHVRLQQQQSLHQYVKNILVPNRTIVVKSFSSREEDDYLDKSYVDADEHISIWNEATVELFQDQLGIIVDDGNSKSKVERCKVDREFIVTALPGPNPEDIYEALWQYFSLISLESQTIQSDNHGIEYSLKALVTERIKIMLDQLFEGNLQLDMIHNLQSTCYNFKYSRIIGNRSPLLLKEITPKNSPLLLDPQAKRVEEIAQLFSSKTRPFFRFRKEIMDEVGQEFLVTKTIQEMEIEKTQDVNFVGLYLSLDDKLPIEYYVKAMDFHRKNYNRVIFMVICDQNSYQFCRDNFEGLKSNGDARVLRKSTDIHDITILSSCNATIISNEMGAIHALLSGGTATVFRPDSKLHPGGPDEFYIPWLISELMSEWYQIE